jgi:hypothetical protein
MGGQSLNASFVCAKAGDENSNSAAVNLYIISSQKYDCAQPQQPLKRLVPKERAFYRAVLPHPHIVDVNLNGGRDLALLQEHVAKDDLVAWGWNPGEGREPAPGNQKTAGQLVQAWIDNGAECPP